MADAVEIVMPMRISRSELKRQREALWQLAAIADREDSIPEDLPGPLEGLIALTDAIHDACESEVATA